MENSLKEAINEAIEEQTDESQDSEDSNSTEKVEGDETEDRSGDDEVKSEDDEKELDADAEEIQTGLDLLRTLRDPSKSTALIKDFALKVGLIKETEDLTSKQELDLKDIIAAELGEEYPDLKDKITKILAASESKAEKQINALREQILARDRKQAEETFSNEFANFIETNKITEAESKEMVIQIKELPPSGNITLTKYLTKIHKLVASDKNIAKDKLAQNEKRESNKKDVVKNLSSGADDDRIKKGSRLPTAREAINAAIRGEKLDD